MSNLQINNLNSFSFNKTYAATHENQNESSEKRNYEQN